MADQNFALILAAGKGTRMQSLRPKALHTLLGEPMLGLVLHAAREVFAERILIVAGHRAEELEKAFPGYRFVRQTEQLGTGQALKVAWPELLDAGVSRVTVLNGDAPLITPQLLAGFVEKASQADLAFASVLLDDPGSYGRVVRANGQLLGIVEAKDYAVELHGAVSGEVNAGLYSMDIKAIAPLLPRLDNRNASGEFYITDLIGLAIGAGLTVTCVPCGDATGLMGINSPVELAAAENILASNIASKLMASGICLHVPQTIRISPLVEVEAGADISGPCEISGNTVIRSGAVIDSHCVIRDSVIGASHIHSFSHITGAIIEDNCQIGPFARLRPGTVLQNDAHVGDFVELKKTLMGQGAKANHLSYLGDATIGAHANIGAGSITCNYDGSNKHHTSIGPNAFIGSNTALVAPVKIGAGSIIGAGSTITRDVPENMLGIARARQENLHWSKK